MPVVKNIKQLAAQVALGDDIESISRAVFKGTDCGAFVAKTQGGVVIGSIVEGCDFGTENHELHFPFHTDDFWQAVKKVEVEANYIWQQTHGCDDCGWVGEWGGNAINPECPTCHGQGASI